MTTYILASAVGTGSSGRRMASICLAARTGCDVPCESARHGAVASTSPLYLPQCPTALHCTVPHLGGEPARSGHDPILSRTGASGNPGAVQGGLAPGSWTVNCFRFCSRFYSVARSRPAYQWTMKSRITAMACSGASGSTPCPHPANRSKRTRCAGRAAAISI
jgi:hypothetical protein